MMCRIHIINIKEIRSRIEYGSGFPFIRFSFSVVWLCRLLRLADNQTRRLAPSPVPVLSSNS